MVRPWYCGPYSLEAYNAKSLQKILGLHWWHKVPHTEMRSRANTHSMEHLVMQRLSASSDGLVMSFECSPIGPHVAFYTLNCSMASEPPAARRSASQIT